MWIRHVKYAIESKEISYSPPTLQLWVEEGSTKHAHFLSPDFWKYHSITDWSQFEILCGIKKIDVFETDIAYSLLNILREGVVNFLIRTTIPRKDMCRSLSRITRQLMFLLSTHAKNTTKLRQKNCRISNIDDVIWLIAR